jgi:hypothetical protein
MGAAPGSLLRITVKIDRFDGFVFRRTPLSRLSRDFSRHASDAPKSRAVTKSDANCVSRTRLSSLVDNAR